MDFSIILPAYNAERYLPECLASIEQQTAQDFECIFIDDGSSDATADLLDAFASSHARVSVIHGPNNGLLLARRRGLLEAQGEYVVFIDADDCFRADTLEIVSNAIEENSPDIVAFHSSRKMDFSTTDDTTTLNAGVYEGERYASVQEHVCRGRFNNMWGKAFRRQCVDLEADYERFRGLMHGEDLFQILPIVDRSVSFEQLDDVLYFYRPNEASSTANYKESQLKDIVTVNRCLRRYADKWGERCHEAAVIGEVNSYVYLLKMSELSTSSPVSKEEAFNEIRLAMTDEGVFKRSAGAGIRPDNKLILKALKDGNRDLARIVAISAERIKGAALLSGRRSRLEHTVERFGFR